MRNLISKLSIICLCLLLSFLAAPIMAKTKEKDRSLKIMITYNEDEEIKEKLNNLAEEMELSAKEFKNTSQLAYWDNEGKELITKLLRSEGFYAPNIYSRTNEENGSKHYVIEFIVAGGNRYKLESVTVKHAKGSNMQVQLPDLSTFDAKLGEYAIAEDIIAVQDELINKVEDNNCLLTLSGTHSALLNHKDDTLSVKYIIKAGPFAKIKSISYEGLESLEEDHVRYLAGLKAGTCFRRTFIRDAREKLQTSGLFTATTPKIPEDVDENGEVPVVFKLRERKHRSIKAGISYGSDLGLGATLGWEHRNFMGRGEELSVDIFGNKDEQLSKINFSKPHFLGKPQTLKAELAADNASYEAFDTREGRMFVGLEREYGTHINVGGGGKITVSRIKETGALGNNFVLLSTPSYISFDKRNNILNPEKGYELRGELEPFYDAESKNKPFLKNVLTAKYYTKLFFHKKSVLAAKLSVGSIFGGKNATIPATERFFAGGAKSVRGFAYQLAGPLNARKAPTGGKSLIEGSVEYRVIRDDNFGVAIFYDIGNVFVRHVPKFNSRFFHGAGFGLRYNTDFGPIRADIAFPIQRRKGVDKSYQIYFGIGQSF